MWRSPACVCRHRARCSGSLKMSGRPFRKDGSPRPAVRDAGGISHYNPRCGRSRQMGNGADSELTRRFTWVAESEPEARAADTADTEQRVPWISHDEKQGVRFSLDACHTWQPVGRRHLCRSVARCRDRGGISNAAMRWSPRCLEPDHNRRCRGARPLSCSACRTCTSSSGQVLGAENLLPSVVPAISCATRLSARLTGMGPRFTPETLPTKQCAAPSMHFESGRRECIGGSEILQDH